MKPEETNIKALSRAILREAHGDAQQILADAEEKAEAIRGKARQQAESQRTQIIENAKREATRIHSETVSTAQMKARRIELEQREKLLDEVFERAREKLTAIQQSTDYDKIARLLLREALANLGVEQALVRADKATLKIMTKEVLESVSKELGVETELGPQLEEGTGVIVGTPDGHRQYDNTLETRLARSKDALRLPVYHLLMGEPL